MNKTTTIIIAVVLIGISFYGGMLYGKNSAPTNSRGNFTANAFGGRGSRGANGGGFANGQIISKDSTGVTISLQAGSSKIILVSPSTPIMKSVAGTVSDLSVGEQISANGTANSDGSITAQTIQIRPASTTRAQ